MQNNISVVVVYRYISWEVGTSKITYFDAWLTTAGLPFSFQYLCSKKEVTMYSLLSKIKDLQKYIFSLFCTLCLSVCYRDLLKSSPMILVGTTSGLVQVNAKTMEICGFINFQGNVFLNV